MANPTDPPRGFRIAGPATAQARRFSSRRLLTGSAATALVAALLVPGTAFADSPSPAPQRVGTAPTAPVGAVAATAPADDTVLQLGVTLSPRDPQALQSFLTGVSTPGSAQYHQYLRTGEFGQRFGADRATLQRAAEALTGLGLHPGTVGSDGLTIPVTATVAEAEKAFGTDIAGYRLADGRTAYANTEAPELPGSIAGSVAGVVGLNTLAAARSNHALPDGAAAAPKSAPKAAAGDGAGVAPHATGTPPQLCQWVQDWQKQSYGREDYRDYYSSNALATVYNMPVGASAGGAGSTVALFELEDYSDAAVAAYQQCYGTSTPVSRVKIDGGPTHAPDLNNYGIESALDIETVLGLVPNANILVYQGPDAQFATKANVLNVYRAMVNDNRAQVLSTSWGICEADADPAMLTSENLIFQQAAAQGQTVVAASGDSGSNGCFRDGGASDPRISTDDPASQPYVTGVGGTSMTGHSADLVQSAWNRGGSTGGGVSRTWKLDAATGYQAGTTGPGYSGTSCTAAAGQACRQVPDVAALADGSNGYLIAVGVDAQGLQYWGRIAGTSGAAPVWAAVAAAANASLQCAAGGPLGFLNPALYRAKGGSGLLDVTTGNNAYIPSGYTGNLYQAGAGYDLATGLGAPNAAVLTDTLCAAAPESPAGTFKAVAPTRLLDTREAGGQTAGGAVGAYQTLSLKIAGRAGIPTQGLTGVVLNVTVTQPRADGHLTVYPSDKALPSTSNINWVKGTTIPNLVTVPVGADGSVKLYNGSWDAAHLIADVSGYYSSTAADGSTFTATGPTRILDTRQSGDQTGGRPASPYQEIPVAIAGRPGLPAQGITAAVLNVTVTGTQSDGHLTAYPSGGARTTTSNLNWTTGQTIANQVIVPVGPDGKVVLLNDTWTSSHVIADIFGYFTAGTAGAQFHTTVPHRLMDTRTGIGTYQGPLEYHSVRNLPLDFGGRLSQSKAVVLNITVTGTLDDGHLEVYPYNGTTTSSALNWSKGQTIANHVTVPVGGSGSIEIYNASLRAEVIVDVLGYYS
ncbi:protease pro-enzyme activation domain-containing protein [Kitasatospora sp. NBC_00240]|uniref:S53 family peptidase n=1 Tax=Kitasatospora sp. NBC_00240 TaxID=2903567 RepID=UPI00225575F2|nr:protease pro-enzyme activation domain-containing protein [Kitasatospora sp. NBC_00240]MCX5211686.1 protease pro-enzyme activation domain-containing protein [Kitasatospora sp. NBC_00240]